MQSMPSANLKDVKQDWLVLVPFSYPSQQYTVTCIDDSKVYIFIPLKKVKLANLVKQ